MVEKAKIDNMIYDIISFDEFCKFSQMYYNQNVAIKEGNFIYPIRLKTDTKPGMYPISGMCYFVEPKTEEELNSYSIKNIINFSDSSSLRELMEKQDKIRNSERSILTTADNIYVADIGPGDSPHMAALKEAIASKHIDLDKYEFRFGPNFNNDRRLLKKDDITMNKFISFLNKMDLKATLTIEDSSPEVPNPMNKTIIVDLTSKED